MAAQGKKQKNKRRRRNSKVTANGTASKPSAPARCLKVRVATINRLAPRDQLIVRSETNVDNAGRKGAQSKQQLCQSICCEAIC